MKIEKIIDLICNKSLIVEFTGQFNDWRKTIIKILEIAPEKKIHVWNCANLLNQLYGISPNIQVAKNVKDLNGDSIIVFDERLDKTKCEWRNFIKLIASLSTFEQSMICFSESIEFKKMMKSKYDCLIRFDKEI